MLTSSINSVARRLAAAAVLATMAGCATGPDLSSDGTPHESKYAEQREGGAASSSDAVHVPPVPHDPAAEKVAQKALPEYVRALQTMRQGEYQKAIIMLQSLSARFPQLSGPLVNQGIAHMKLEEFGDAEDSLQAALKVNERNPYAHNALGVVLREQGKFEDALKHYRRALALDPKYARAHFNLAVLAELYMQDLNLALQHFRAYQNLQKQPDQNVANWITDLERRAPDPLPADPSPVPGQNGTGTASESGSGTTTESDNPPPEKEAS